EPQTLAPAGPSASEHCLSSLHSLSRPPWSQTGTYHRGPGDTVWRMSEPRGVALVTGASSGIGEATVRALASEGFQVVAAARRVERCEAVAREVEGRALHLDVADAESV